MTKRAPVNQKTFSAWLALLPLFILVVGFTFFPLIKILFIGLGKTVQPFQINSFALLVKDANFRQALKNTLILCLGVVPASLVINFTARNHYSKVFIRHFTISKAQRKHLIREQQPKRYNNVWVWIILIGILALVFVGLYYLFIYLKGRNQKSKR